MQCNECKLLGLEVLANLECALNPEFLVSSLVCCANLEVTKGNILAAHACEYKVDVGLTCSELVAECDDVTVSKVILCLEEVQVLALG